MLLRKATPAAGPGAEHDGLDLNERPHTARVQGRQRYTQKPIGPSTAACALAVGYGM